MPAKPPSGSIGIGSRRQPPESVKSALKPSQEVQVMTGLLRELSAFVVQLTRIAKTVADDMETAAKAKKQGVE
jgi:hypothetical protein